MKYHFGKEKKKIPEESFFFNNFVPFLGFVDTWGSNGDSNQSNSSQKTR